MTEPALFLEFDKPGEARVRYEYSCAAVMASHRLAMEFDGWYVAGQPPVKEVRTAFTVAAAGGRWLVPVPPGLLEKPLRWDRRA